MTGRMSIVPGTMSALLLAATLPCTAPAQAPRRAAVRPVASATARDAARLVGDSVTAVLTRALADNAFPGAVALVGTGSGVLATVGVGRLDATDVTRPDVTTIYDLASLTKIIATTSLILHLVDDGRVALDSAVVR